MLNGGKIRDIRISKGYTTNDISLLSKNYTTHISKSYLEELERGTKSNPSFNIVETLAILLGVKIDELKIN